MRLERARIQAYVTRTKLYQPDSFRSTVPCEGAYQARERRRWVVFINWCIEGTASHSEHSWVEIIGARSVSVLFVYTSDVSKSFCSLPLSISTSWSEASWIVHFMKSHEVFYMQCCDKWFYHLCMYRVKGAIARFSTEPSNHVCSWDPHTYLPLVLKRYFSGHRVGFWYAAYF